MCDNNKQSVLKQANIEQEAATVLHVFITMLMQKICLIS